MWRALFAIRFVSGIAVVGSVYEGFETYFQGEKGDEKRNEALSTTWGLSRREEQQDQAEQELVEGLLRYCLEAPHV